MSLLAHLFGETDGGFESPNPSTWHHLKNVGLKRLDPASLNDLGYLFIWAQHLGGLDFPVLTSDGLEKEAEEVESKVEVTETRIGPIVEAIRERLRSRMALQKQVSLLAKARTQAIEPRIPEGIAHIFPAKTSCTIRNWSSVDFDQYKTLEVVRHLIENKIVENTDYLYRIQMNRTAATLIALVAVKPDYPKRAPVFCLNLHWAGEHNVHNSERIRNLERYVNVGFDDEKLAGKFRPHILSLQLYRLMTSLDATLEAWETQSTKTGSSKSGDFSREKLFLHPVRGRNRSLPMVYDYKLQVYSQH